MGRGVDRTRAPGSRSDRTARASSGALRVAGLVAWVVEHAGGLEPDEAAVSAGERERVASPVDGPAYERMVEGDSLVPALPFLVPAKRAGHPRSPTPHEVEDGRLRRHWHGHGSASTVRHGPGEHPPTR